MKLYRITVAGCGSFPFDMLRQCQAWPANKDQSENILMSAPTQARRIEVTLVSAQRPHPAMIAGWNLANWEVLTIGSG